MKGKGRWSHRSGSPLSPWKRWSAEALKLWTDTVYTAVRKGHGQILSVDAWAAANLARVGWVNHHRHRQETARSGCTGSRTSWDCHGQAKAKVQNAKTNSALAKRPTGTPNTKRNHGNAQRPSGSEKTRRCVESPCHANAQPTCVKLQSPASPRPHSRPPQPNAHP